MQKCFHCLGTAASSSLPLARSHGNGVGTPKRDAAVVSRHHIGVQRVVGESKGGLHLPLRWEGQQRWENSLHFHPPIVWGYSGLSEHWSCCTFSYLSAPAASDMSLKPHLGGSSESQIKARIDITSRFSQFCFKKQLWKHSIYSRIELMSVPRSKGLNSSQLDRFSTDIFQITVSGVCLEELCPLGSHHGSCGTGPRSGVQEQIQHPPVLPPSIQPIPCSILRSQEDRMRVWPCKHLIWRTQSSFIQVTSPPPPSTTPFQLPHINGEGVDITELWVPKGKEGQLSIACRHSFYLLHTFLCGSE